MIPRKPLTPNKRVLTPVLGAQWYPSPRPKAIERPQIVTHNTSGRGQQGESSSGGPGVRPIIRKGSTRASN